MALIAHLMEHKNNYGPHLIIVPNAVLVNWKSELTQWLPTVSLPWPHTWPCDWQCLQHLGPPHVGHSPERRLWELYPNTF